VLHRIPGLSRVEECERIVEFYHSDFEAISVALDRQFRTMHNRAQVLLAICGILISASVLVTTGKLIARPVSGLTGKPSVAGIVLVVAGMLEVAAAAVVVGGVMSVRWITQQPGTEVRAWVMSNLVYRDQKTDVYHVAVLLVLLSMLAYQTAITIALLQR
jgi:hypothetical protein